MQLYHNAHVRHIKFTTVCRPEYLRQEPVLQSFPALAPYMHLSFTNHALQALRLDRGSPYRWQQASNRAEYSIQILTVAV